MQNIVMLPGSGEGERMLRSPRGRCALRMMKRYADKIVILNSAMKREMECLGFEGSRLVMLGCEADPGKFRPAKNGEKEVLRERWKIPPHATVIAFAGRLVPGKGLTTLLDAFAALRSRHPDLLLLIAGDGQLGPTLQATVSNRGLSNSVLFTGQLGDSDVGEILRCSDIYALPSDSEGIPAALVEAMASGLPAVVSDIPGTEIVVDDIHGLRFAIGDVKNLIAALENVIVNCDRRTRMGRAAHELFLARFTPDKVAHEHELMYEHILETRAYMQRANTSTLRS